MKCPKCGGKVTYQGLHHLECETPECDNSAEGLATISIPEESSPKPHKGPGFWYMFRPISNHPPDPDDGLDDEDTDPGVKASTSHGISWSDYEEVRYLYGNKALAFGTALTHGHCPGEGVLQIDQAHWAPGLFRGLVGSSVYCSLVGSGKQKRYRITITEVSSDGPRVRFEVSDNETIAVLVQNPTVGVYLDDTPYSGFSDTRHYDGIVPGSFEDLQRRKTAIIDAARELVKNARPSSTTVFAFEVHMLNLEPLRRALEALDEPDED